MPAITVKNIPSSLYKRLKNSAAKNHRSINSEVIALIDGALSSNTIDPEEYLIGVRKLRESLQTPPLTNEFLENAKNEGRP